MVEAREPGCWDRDPRACVDTCMHKPVPLRAGGGQRCEGVEEGWLWMQVCPVVELVSSSKEEGDREGGASSVG